MPINPPNRLSPLCIAIVTALVGQIANAETDMPSMTMQKITVTAETSARDKTQQGAVYTEDYTPAQQASHLSDFLNVVPGVSVGGTSSVNQRVRIRGLDDTNLKVSIDGARQEGALFYHMGDLTIDPDLLKQSEVSVGNNSVTLGNDAIGGAVAFETVDAVDLLKPGQKIGAKLKTSYADNNDELLTSAMVYSLPNDNIDLLAYYSKRDTESGEDGDGRKLFEDSETDNILLKAGATVADDHRIGASYSSTEKEGIFPFRPDFPSLPNSRGNDVIPQKVERKTSTIDYGFSPLNPWVDVKANIYQTETSIKRDADYNKNPGFEWKAKVKTTGGKVENTSVIDTDSGSHKLIAGVEHYKKEGEMTRDYIKKGSDEAKTTSVYLEDQWQIDKLTLTPGVRYDRYKSPEFISGGKTYDNVVGALAASYEIAPQTQIFASYTQLFNGPDLGQAIFNADGEGIYVNRNLKPEEGYNTEAGIATTLRGVTNAEDALQLSAKYFRSNIENYQQYVRGGDGRPGRVGINCATGELGGKCQGMYNSDEDYKIDGVELAANYSADKFGMGLSYSRARSEGKDTGGSIPSVSGSSADTGDRYMVNFNYSPNEEMELGWRSTYVASLTDKVSPLKGDSKLDIHDDFKVKKPSYDVHDVYLSYSPRQFEGLKATLGVYNLFDETYASHASRLDITNDETTDFEPGRNFKASLSYQF